MVPTSRITAVYRVAATASTVDARAQALAVEQSVEMPLEAISDARVLSEVVGRVEGIDESGAGQFLVRLGLATETTGHEAGQLMNMLFGNASILDDVALVDLDLPEDLRRSFAGPGHGVDGIRARLGVPRRALTASALKPQGLPPDGLGDLAARMVEGGLDLIKDDHGLADQTSAPFAARVGAVAARLEPMGALDRDLPSLSGNLDQLRAQLRIAADHGVRGALVAPMVVGLPSFHTLVREHPDVIFMAHPALAGVSRIAPPVLLGSLYRLCGADATVFPHHGGRFGYCPETCEALAHAARRTWPPLAGCLPVPAGGMSLERVEDMLTSYGPDVMLLIGGALLVAGDDLVREASGFRHRVEQVTERLVGREA